MNKRDEFDDPKGSDLLGSVGPKAAFFIVLIALSFMIGVVWKLYAGGGSSSTNKNIPIIRADTTPYKVTPEDPGGMEMPHKDSTIFSSLNSASDEDRGVENLLADSDEEEPMPRSQLFAGLNTERNTDLHAEAQETPLDQPLSEDEERIVSQVKEAEAIVTNLVESGADAIATASDDAEQVSEEAVEKTQENLAETIKVPEKVEPVVEQKEEVAIVEQAKEAEVKVEPKVEVKEEPKIELKAEPEVVKPAPKKVEPPKEKPKPVVKAKPKPAPKKAAASTPVKMGGDYYVQLASVQSRAGADSEWKKLKSKYGSILSGYGYRVETASLPKGTYYRIQAGPVSKSQAAKTCNAIKRQSPGGCLLKKK